MVKEINFQISFTDKWFYTFVTAIVIVALAVGIYAVAPNPGHSADELDLSGGVSGDAIFNGRVGIGTSIPTARLDVAGDILSSDIVAAGFFGDGSGLTDLRVRITGQDACDSTNDGLLRYRSDLCSGDDLKSSYFDVCTKTGSSTYGWKTISTNAWTDVACDTDGCPLGQNYYQCTGEYAAPGCYSSRPANCYFFEFECFLAGTEILMEDGTYKNIEQVQEGEWVVSYDTENNLKTISKVSEYFVHEEVEGYVIINGELEVTSNHPMWIVNRQEWARVYTIELGDVLLDSNQQEVIVISLENINGLNTVYNLELEGEYNNYFAGDILVHNKIYP